MGSGRKRDATSVLVYFAGVRFIHYVRHTLKDEDKHKYDEFAELMVHYRKRQIEVATLKQRVRELFIGYPQLTEEFTRFLPVSATSYKECVEESLKHNEDVFKEFLNSKILEELDVGAISIAKARCKLSQIFKDHPHLIDEFDSFVTVSAVAYGKTIRAYFRDRNKRSRCREFVRLLRQYESGSMNLSDVRKDVIKLFKHHRILLRGLNRFLPENLCIPLF